MTRPGIIVLSVLAVAASTSCKSRRSGPADPGSSSPPASSAAPALSAPSPSPAEAVAAGWADPAVRPVAWHVSPRNVAVDERDLFFTDDRGDGSVFRLPKEGGVAEVVATGQKMLGRIAAGAGGACWIASASVVFASRGKEPVVILPMTQNGGAVD